MTIGRAPELDAADRRPHRLPGARADLGNGGGTAVLEDAGSSHGTYVDGARISGADRAARRAAGAARRPGAGGRAPPRGLEAGRTIVVRAGREPGDPGGRAGRAWRPTRRSSGCARACAPGTRSSASTRARATGAGCCATSTRDVPAPQRQRRAAVRADRRHALAGRSDRARRAAPRRPRAGAAGQAARRPRRARLPRRRGRRARSAAAPAPQEPAAAAVHAAREDVPARRPDVRAALPRRRLGAVPAPRADLDRGADGRRARRCSAI